MGRHRGKYDTAPCHTVGVSAEPLDAEAQYFVTGEEEPRRVLVAPTSEKWTSAQKEALDTVVNYWKALTSSAKDAESFIADDYVGRFNGDVSADDKSEAVAWIAESLKIRKTAIVKISPIFVKIHGTIAIVHYSYFWLYDSPTRRKLGEAGHYYDVFRKRDGNYQLISDTGGPDA